MKKAISYMLIGALAAGMISVYMDNDCTFKRKIRKLKKSSIDAANKVMENM